MSKSVHLRYRVEWGFAVSERPTYIWPRTPAVGVALLSVHYECKCIVKVGTHFQWRGAVWLDDKMAELGKPPLQNMLGWGWVRISKFAFRFQLF